MPYDPRQMQAISRMGIGMMAPEPSPFQQPQQQPRRSSEWWEQPLPARRRQPEDQPEDQKTGQSADQKPEYEPRQPPSLLQMLMLGGNPTYSGTPRSGSSASPWGWLGSVGGSRPSR